MRHFAFSACLILGVALSALRGAAFEIEAFERFGPADASARIAVISTVDIDLFAPVITEFMTQHPNLGIEYTVASSSQVKRAIEQGAAFDVAISSAMDLQMKLVNDGYAQSYQSVATGALPSWATWRDHLFAFTQEPAAIVLSRSYFEARAVPRSRQELIAVMRAHPDDFAGRVITYDLRQSGLGYLFATQDARSSEAYWRLTEVMGQAKAKLSCCSSDMIDAVAQGSALVAYNVLGSYAAARRDAEAFVILRPTDFETVMLRTAFIPSAAQNLKDAGKFIDTLIQRAMSERPIFGQSFQTTAQDGTQDVPINRIRLGPSLLVYLDQYKRNKFLTSWEASILQDPQPVD